MKLSQKQINTKLIFFNILNSEYYVCKVDDSLYKHVCNCLVWRELLKYVLYRNELCLLSSAQVGE